MVQFNKMDLCGGVELGPFYSLGPELWQWWGRVMFNLISSELVFSDEPYWRMGAGWSYVRFNNLNFDGEKVGYGKFYC